MQENKPKTNPVDQVSQGSSLCHFGQDPFCFQSHSHYPNGTLKIFEALG